LKYLPKVLNWNTNKLKNIQGFFYGCQSLESIPDISNWNTSNLEDMGHLFYGCESIKYLPSFNWNINKVSNSMILKAIKKIKRKSLGEITSDEKTSIEVLKKIYKFINPRTPELKLYSDLAEEENISENFKK
jgi:surface protein